MRLKQFSPLRMSHQLKTLQWLEKAINRILYDLAGKFKS